MLGEHQAWKLGKQAGELAGGFLKLHERDMVEKLFIGDRKKQEQTIQGEL